MMSSTRLGMRGLQIPSLVGLWCALADAKPPFADVNNTGFIQLVVTNWGCPFDVVSVPLTDEIDIVLFK